MLATFAAFGRNDLRSIRRDTILIVVVLGPFIYAAATWVVPPLGEFLARRYGFDLVPYHPLILSAFTVLGPAILLGAMCGLLLLDDKDQHTLAALRVTPVPRSAYPLYRAVLTTILTAVAVVTALALSRLAPADVVAAGVVIGIAAGLLATLVGLTMAALAGNKVEGLAIIRAIGLLVFAVPLIPFFIDSPWEPAFGVLPSYWPAKALWLAVDGAGFWPYVLVGIVYNAVLAALLLRRLARSEP